MNILVIKGILCIIQVIFFVEVLTKGSCWLVPFQALIAIVTMLL